MTITIEALKEKARRHEQDEEWRQALDQYLRAIRRLDEEDRPDISLHNRVGDLYARVGSPEEAVEHYETAVDLYEESGLANNAIAVCKKIIRNVPQRHRVYLRMGMIRARQGFLVDARHHFLTYAERMKAAGDFDEAMRALVEFAELVPGDAEIRLAIAAQFRQHDRTDEAADQLARAYGALRTDGDERATEVGEQLLELRPGVDLEALAVAARPDAPLETTSFSAEDLDEPSGAGAEIEDPDLGGFEIALAADGSDDGSTEDPPSAEHAPEPEERPRTDEALDDEPFEVGEPLPLMMFDDDEEASAAASAEVAGFDEEPSDAVGAEAEAFGEVMSDAASAEAEAFGEEPSDPPGAEADAFGDADRLDIAHGPAGRDGSEGSDPGHDVLDDVAAGEDSEAPVEDEEATPLPFLAGTEVPPVEPSPTAPGLADLEAADAWTDPGGSESGAAGSEEDADDLHGAIEDAFEDRRSEERGEDASADPATDPWDPPAAPSTGPDAAPAEEHAGFHLDEGPAEAVRAAPGKETGDAFAAEADRAPANDVEACQRAVEQAFRAGTEPELVAAYLALARALEASGAGERATGVYQQILGIDPGHEAARAALGRVVEPAEPPPEVSSSEDYVDLGALILGEDADKTTRFVVAYEEPSGDEDADFAKMLRQFKAKVAENVDSSDVKAHHDLGVAYREMGLLDEAIEQFQKALRASSDHLATYEALGQAFLDKGAYAPAVRVLSRALDAPWEVEDELLGIYYYLGRAYEAQGNATQAVEFYDRVFSLDINFADVTERLRVLR